MAGVPPSVRLGAIDHALLNALSATGQSARAHVALDAGAVRAVLDAVHALAERRVAEGCVCIGTKGQIRDGKARRRARAAQRGHRVRSGGVRVGSALGQGESQGPKGEQSEDT
jgi:hypothetical protein